MEEKENYEEILEILKQEKEKLDKMDLIKKYLELVNKIGTMEEKIRELKFIKMRKCPHIFVRTDIVSDDWENKEKVIYYCPMCGLTNFYGVHNMNDTNEQQEMNICFRDRNPYGIIVPKLIISKEEADEYYNTIKNSGLSYQEMALAIEEHFKSKVMKRQK